MSIPVGYKLLKVEWLHQRVCVSYSFIDVTVLYSTEYVLPLTIRVEFLPSLSSLNPHGCTCVCVHINMSMCTHPNSMGPPHKDPLPQPCRDQVLNLLTSQGHMFWCRHRWGKDLPHMADWGVLCIPSSPQSPSREGSTLAFQAPVRHSMPAPSVGLAQ